MARVALNIPPGVVEDDTDFTVGQGAWTEADKVRFWRGRPELWGGWELLTTTALNGLCRGLFVWRDNDDALNIAFGTSEELSVYVQGDFFDITPTDFVAGNEDGIGGRGFGTGAYSVGAYSQPSDEDFWPLTWSFASFGETLIANPRGQGLWQWSNDGSAAAATISRVVEVEDDFTSYADNTALDAVYTRGTGWAMDAANDQVDCDGSQVADSDLERASYAHTVDKWYRVEVDFSNRSAGSISAYGDGNEGEASSAASGTVSVQYLAANASAAVGARADAGFVGSVDEIRVIELNAPDEVTYMTVTPQRQVMVYGCNEEATNTFNPRCIRYGDFETVSDWVTSPSNNAGEIILDGSGALVAARETAYGAFVWTTNELYFREYIGDPAQTYRFTLVGTGCGLIGPNAAAVLGQVAYWMSADGQFWQCPIGGAPVRISSPVQDEVADNIAGGQQAKVYAATLAEFNEVIWFYPDSRDGSENSRGYSYQITDGVWAGPHTLDRTAFIDAGPGFFPVGVDEQGNAYFHEKGLTANGGVITGALATGDIYIAEGGRVAMIRGMWPDIQGQSGQITLTVTVKEHPQGDALTDRTLTIAPGDDRVQWRSSGRLIRMRFSWEDAPMAGRFGQINLDLKARGRR